MIKGRLVALEKALTASHMNIQRAAEAITGPVPCNVSETKLPTSDNVMASIERLENMAQDLISRTSALAGVIEGSGENCAGTTLRPGGLKERY